MSESTNDANDPAIDVPQRLFKIESTVTHLQYDVEQLSQVALDLQADIRQLQQSIEKLTTRMERMSDDPEERNPELERPPHY